MNTKETIMQDFLDLNPKEQAEIIQSVSYRLGKTPTILEKDIWICWVLNHLFSIPNHLPMAFKGGTSLSKVFNIIHRFSEDVDITIDYRGFELKEDPFSEEISKNAIKKISEKLKDCLKQYVHSIVFPYFESLRTEYFQSCPPIDIDEHAEKLYFYYPSVFENNKNYLASSVLLEFGGRNITEPHESHLLKPYISEYITELSFPQPVVTVLSPQRTFWEKATLIHVECNRDDFKHDVHRLSRHWYDLALLAEHKTLEATTINSLTMLQDVLKHKKVFYNSSYANYDECLKGNFKLIPSDNILKKLEYDFNHMLQSGMFYAEEPNFNYIMNIVDRLEKTINELIKKGKYS